MGQILEKNNENTKGSSCKIVLETQQSPTRDDVLPESKNVQLPDIQKIPKNLDILDVRDSIEINALSSNEKSSRKKKNIAEIEQLKKK